MESHEPTSARKQKRLWRGHWTARANILEVGVSELVDTEIVADVSPGQGPRTIHEVVKRPLIDAYDRRHDRDCKSLYTMRGVGGKPKRQNRGSRDVGRVCELRRSAKIIEDNLGCTPGIRVNPQDGVMSKCSCTTIVNTIRGVHP